MATLRVSMFVLAATTADGWRPGIGDPTFMGWLTVAAYFGAAYLCYQVRREALHLAPALRRTESATASRFWGWLAILFIALGLNKQLDLQSLLTQIGRDASRSQGWYDSRRSVQWNFIITLTVVGGLIIAWLMWTMRSHWRERGLAVIGTTFILLFIVIRAASFHRFDEFLGWDIFGFAMNWLLELGGIACVSIAAVKQSPVLAGKLRAQWQRLRRLSPMLRSESPRRRQPISRVQTQQRDSFRWMADRVRRGR